ncbi:SPOR domain-containing protein [Caenimonas aquaedulcis]|uniref:SPOR domain-containing protein n=1 Tax=Caenimonas aquaedulcis TaxID=2793270 RepID=A0A931MI66_9BURK|nr:SPOR domain-containing protein [Caenimonas aquaedulcis]MBG9388910.1 SPOR domain-containing protein [Caenimonas aquaedulcis]
MLRLVVLALLLANAGYYAWSQNLLAPWGIAPAQQSEPHRVEQQLRPQAIRLVASDEAKRIEASTLARAPECLQAGLFDDTQTASLKLAMDGWPAGSWAFEGGVEPPRWIVYMGKYPSAENVSRKKAELRQLGISFESLINPSLEPGLSLGGYPTEAAAKQQLEALASRGVRTAKVVLEREEVRGQVLRLPAVDDSLRPRLDDLKTALGSRTLRACR